MKFKKAALYLSGILVGLVPPAFSTFQYFEVDYLMSAVREDAEIRFLDDETRNRAIDSLQKLELLCSSNRIDPLSFGSCLAARSNSKPEEIRFGKDNFERSYVDWVYKDGVARRIDSTGDGIYDCEIQVYRGEIKEDCPNITGKKIKKKFFVN